jgi:hypothetical protein
MTFFIARRQLIRWSAVQQQRGRQPDRYYSQQFGT